MYADVNCAQGNAIVKHPRVNNTGTPRIAVGTVLKPASNGNPGHGGNEYDFAAEDFPRMHLTANLDVHGAEMHDRWRNGDAFAWDCAAAEAEATEASE